MANEHTGLFFCGLLRFTNARDYPVVLVPRVLWCTFAAVACCDMVLYHFAPDGIIPYLSDSLVLPLRSSLTAAVAHLPALNCSLVPLRSCAPLHAARTHLGGRIPRFLRGRQRSTTKTLVPAPH